MSWLGRRCPPSRVRIDAQGQKRKPMKKRGEPLAPALPVPVYRVFDVHREFDQSLKLVVSCPQFCNDEGEAHRHHRHAIATSSARPKPTTKASPRARLMRA